MQLVQIKLLIPFRRKVIFGVACCCEVCKLQWCTGNPNCSLSSFLSLCQRNSPAPSLPVCMLDTSTLNLALAWAWKYLLQYFECFCHPFESSQKSNNSLSVCLGYLHTGERLRKKWASEKCRVPSLFSKNSDALCSQPCTFCKGRGSGWMRGCPCEKMIPKYNFH